MISPVFLTWKFFSFNVALAAVALMILRIDEIFESINFFKSFYRVNVFI